MIRFELYRWTRSRRLLLLTAVFFFSAVTSVLVSAYLPEILGSVGGDGDVQVTVADPTWQDLIAAYFKNSSQLAILFSCYLAAWGCALGTDDRLQLYYRSRMGRAVEVQGPRFVVSAAVVTGAVVGGAAVALYCTNVLAEGVDAGRAVTALAVQGAGLLIFSLLAGCLACTRLHPGAATAIVVGLAMLGGAGQSIAVVRDWSPTALLIPVDLLGDAAPTDYARPLAVSVVVLAVSAVTVLSRDVRHGVRRGSPRRVHPGTATASVHAVPTGRLPAAGNEEGFVRATNRDGARART